MHALLEGVSATVATDPRRFTDNPLSGVSRTKLLRQVQAESGDSGTIVATDEAAVDELVAAKAAAKQWTSRVAMRLAPGFREVVFRQLDRLHDAEEWVGNDRPVSLESFKSFIRTVVHLRVAKFPGLALMPNGNLMAMWHNGEDRLSVEFLESDRVRWIVSMCRGASWERAAGETALVRLPAVLAPYNGEAWLSGS